MNVTARMLGGLLALASCGVVRCAGAAVVDHVGGLPEHALAALPSSVTSAVLIDKMAQLRNTEGGRYLWEFLSTSGMTEGVEASWPALASDLGLSPDQAVDELLGRRVIVATGVKPRSSWVLATHVTAAVEKNLRERLRPAARSLVKGFPIMAIGHGEFELATSLATGDNAGEKLATVILSSAGNPLFDDVLEAMNPARTATEAGAALPMPDTSQRIDAMMLQRMPRGERETVLIATIERRAIELTCVSEGSSETQPASLPGSVLRTLEGQAGVAALAAAWGGMSPPASEPTLLQDIFWAILPLDPANRDSFGSGNAFCVVPGRSVMWAAALTGTGEPAAVADEAARSMTSSRDHAGSSFNGEAPSALRVLQATVLPAGKFGVMLEPDSELTWTADRDSHGGAWWVASCGERVIRPGPGNDVVFTLVAHPARMSVLFRGAGQVETLMNLLAKRVDSVRFQMRASKDKPGRCVGQGRIDFAQ